MKVNIRIVLILFLFTILFATGCELDIAEDEVITSDTAIREGTPGVFKDSEVGGVTYSTSSGLGGITDSKGQFYYNPGDMVSFSLGGTSLGSVKAVPVLTPVTVIGATDTSDPRVVNMSRLLQSLDADGDPSNGIGISESTRESLETTKIDFDQPVSEFESSASAVVTASVGRPMVSVQQAMTHLHNTMKDEGLDNNVADESKFKAITPNFDGKPPKLVLDKRIPAYLKERQPKITISADEAGSIRYLGNCSGDKSSIVVGDNEITLSSLSDGVYRCGLVVTDDVGNNSDKLFFGDFTVDTVPPELKVSAQVFPLTNDNTPEFVMVASEASTIIYSGGCQSQTAEAVAGENRITLNRLADGKYSQCKLQLKDPTGHLSSVVSLTTFQVDTASPKLKLLADIANFTNTSTPSIRFSSNEPGSIRYLDECSSSSDQAVAGENTITLNALGDGQYGQCRITVTDAAGNVSTLQTAAFVVDTILPTLRWIAKIPSATQDTTPSFTFNVSEASKIIYSGSCSSEVTEAVVGDNEITLNKLEDGEYSDCTIQLSDAAGNKSSSDALSLSGMFRIDTTAPTLNLTKEITSHVNDSTPSFSFNSTEDLKINYAGSCSSAALTAVAGDNEIVLNELSDGSYTDCELKVRDSVGNTATLSLGSFTVDTVAPSLSLTKALPSAGNDATPSFIINVSETSKIGYSGSCASSVSVVQAGENEITLNELGDGTYTDCKIQLNDSAGNQSNLHPFASFLVDTTAPALSLTTAISSHVNDPTPSFEFTSAESVTISYVGSCSSTSTSAIAGDNEIVLNELSDGSYTDCELKVKDSVGNTAKLSLGSFTVDTVAPSLSLTKALPSAGNDATPSFIINVSETSKIGYSGSCASSVSAVQAGENEITLNELGDGTYTDCKIQLSDSAGNQSNLHPFASFLVDTTAPDLSVKTAILTHVNDPTPSFEFTSTESGTISYVGSCSSTSTSAIAGVNEITLNNLSDGTYADCQLKVVDVVGNVATLSIGSFTIDTIPPSLVLTSAVPTKTNDVTPSLSFSSNEAGEISYAGACSSGTSSANAGDNTITLNSLSDGNYSDCELMVTDAAGNAAPLALGSFAIDATAPVLSMKQGIPSFINESSPFLTFSSSEPGTISYSGTCSSNTTQVVGDGQGVINYQSFKINCGTGCGSHHPDNDAQFTALFDHANNSGTTLTHEGKAAATKAFTWPSSGRLPSWGDDWYGWQISGYFVPKETGTYEFQLTSDDKSDLRIGSNFVSYNYEGNYSPVGSIQLVANQAYSLRVRWEEGVGGQNLYLKWKKPSQSNAGSYSFDEDEIWNVSPSGSSGSSNISTDIVLNQLPEGYYYGCSLAVTDSAGNTSTPLSIAPFTIDLTPPVGGSTLESLGKIAGNPTAYLNLSATDQTGVTGYCISVNSMNPSTSSSCWTSVNSVTNFTQNSVPFAYGDVEAVYAWYRDSALNISNNTTVDVSRKPPRLDSLQALYEGTEPITGNETNPNWNDQSGNNNTITNFRSAPSQATVDGMKFGLASPSSIQVIQGDENSGFSLPFAMNSGSYTIAYMARYIGDKNDTTYNKRIFDAQSGTGQNTLWGFHGGVAGRSHNGEKGWYTNTDYKMSEPDTWIIGVETEVSSRFNGMDFTNHYQQSGTTYPRRPSAGFNPTLTVNYGHYHGSESSRWQVAELIVWNTELSEAEQIEAEEYLAKKYSHTSFESVKSSLNDYKNHFASSVADGWYGIYDGAQVGYGDGGWYTGLGKFFELNDKWYWGYALTNGSQAGYVSYANRNGANQTRSWKSPSFEHGNYKLHAIVNGGGGGGGRARGSGGGAGGMAYFLNRSYDQIDFQVEVGAGGSWGGLWKSNQNGPGGDSMLSWSMSGSNQYIRGYGGYEGVDGCYYCTVSGGGYDGNSKDGGGNGGGSYSYSSHYGQQGGMPYEPNVTVGGQNTLSEIAKAYGVSYRIGRYWWWSDYVWGNGGAGSRYGVGMDRYARDGFYGGYGWVLFIMDANSY